MNWSEEAPERCVSDRDLHLKLAKLSGMSLDEIQTRIDLTKIRLEGDGFEIVTIKKTKSAE